MRAVASCGCLAVCLVRESTPTLTCMTLYCTDGAHPHTHPPHPAHYVAAVGLHTVPLGQAAENTCRKEVMARRWAKDIRDGKQIRISV